MANIADMCGRIMHIRLRLACEVVFGLPNIHPVSRKREGKEAIVHANEGECLLLNAGRPELNPLQDLWAQDVDASIDLVPNKPLQRSNKPGCDI